MTNGKADERPNPVGRFKPSEPGPSLHVYDDRGKAAGVADTLPEETRVATRKIDGRQRYVIEKRAGGSVSSGVSLETWVEVEVEPDG